MLTALPAAMRYILKAESYDRRGERRKTVLDNSRKRCSDIYDDVIPSFPLPLRSGDSEPMIDLQTLLNQVYEIYDYDLVVDYSQEQVPTLSESDAIWADALLRQQGLR